MFTNLFERGLDVKGLQEVLDVKFQHYEPAKGAVNNSMTERDYKELRYLIDESLRYLEKHTQHTNPQEFETFTSFYLDKISVYPYKMQTSADIKLSKQMMSVCAQILNNSHVFTSDIETQIRNLGWVIQDNTDSVHIDEFLIELEKGKNYPLFERVMHLFCVESDLCTFEFAKLSLTSQFDSKNKGALLKVVMDVFQNKFMNGESRPAFADEIEKNISWLCATYLQCRPADRCVDPGMVSKLMTLSEPAQTFYDQNEPLFDSILNTLDFIGEATYGADYQKIKSVGRALNLEGDYKYWRDSSYGLSEEASSKVELPEV